MFLFYSLASILKRGIVNHRYTYTTEPESDLDLDAESEHETDFSYDDIFLANLDNLDIIDLSSMLRQGAKLGIPNGRMNQIRSKLGR